MDYDIFRERALESLREYISLLPEPTIADSKSLFAHRSYSIWAAETILQAVEKSRRISPVTIIEQFAWKFNKYSCNHYMFAVAHDVALDILDTVCFLKGEER